MVKVQEEGTVGFVGGEGDAESWPRISGSAVFEDTTTGRDGGGGNQLSQQLDEHLVAVEKNECAGPEQTNKALLVECRLQVSVALLGDQIDDGRLPLLGILEGGPDAVGVLHGHVRLRLECVIRLNGEKRPERESRTKNQEEVETVGDGRLAVPQSKRLASNGRSPPTARRREAKAWAYDKAR